MGHLESIINLPEISLWDPGEKTGKTRLIVF